MGKTIRWILITKFLLLAVSQASAQIPDSEKTIVSPDGLRQAEVTAASELQVSCANCAGGVVSTKTPLTPESPAGATVGVASGQAVAANATRRGLILINTSSATISCTVTAAAVLNNGVTLVPLAAWTMNEYTFALGAVNCIASAAGANLSVQEFSQ